MTGRVFILMSMLGKIKKSSFLKQNAVFFIGALLVSVLNYLYYPILGRLLNLTEYGEVQILVSLFLQLIIFMTVLGQVTVNVVANYDDVRQRNKIIFELQKVAFMISIGIFIIGSACSWWVASVLQFESPWPFIVLLLALIATVPFTFQTSYLRGMKKFGTVSLSNILGAISKLIFSVAFIVIGWGTAGAIGGVVAAQVVASLYAFRVSRKLDYGSITNQRYFAFPDIKAILPELKFSIFVLIASLGVTILSSLDTVIVKAFFDPEVAGGYAGISTVAKIIFFLTASVAQVMLPSIKLHAPKVENRRLLLKSFALVATLGGGAFVVFALFPQFIMTTLMGNSFAPYAHILPTLSLALFLVSVINLIVCYYIALRRYEIAGVVSVGVVVTIILLIFGHGSLDVVALNLMYGSAILLGVFAVWRGGYELMARRRM